MEPSSDRLTWDEYFLGVAALSAMRSKDPNTQVGCVIVNKHYRICGIGYNGFPKLDNNKCISSGTTGVPNENFPLALDNDLVFPWCRPNPKDPSVDNKYYYVCHAEMNAVLNKNIHSIEGCTLYCTLLPCLNCAKILIQSRVSALVYSDNSKDEQPMYAASLQLMRSAGMSIRNRPLVRKISIPSDERSQQEASSVDSVYVC